MQPHTPASFTEALWECMNQCGWEDLVQRTVDGGTTRSLLEQTFAELVADLTCVHPDEWPGADLVDQFGAALDSARIRQPADSPDHVAVVDLLELRGLQDLGLNVRLLRLLEAEPPQNTSIHDLSPYPHQR